MVHLPLTMNDGCPRSEMDRPAPIIAQSRKVLLAQCVLNALAEAHATPDEQADALRLAVEFIPRAVTFHLH